MFVVGNKIKTVSKIYMVLGCLISLVLGIIVFDDWHNMWVYSVLIWVLGPFFSYASFLLIYGFGVIVDKCESTPNNN